MLFLCKLTWVQSQCDKCINAQYYHDSFTLSFCKSIAEIGTDVVFFFFRGFYISSNMEMFLMCQFHYTIIQYVNDFNNNKNLVKELVNVAGRRLTNKGLTLS